MAENLWEEIRERTDLVETVSAYVTLRKAGREHKGLCPFHQEKTSSFTVNREKQVWHCFGCGAGGDVFGFLSKIENITLREAAERLGERVGIQLESSPEARRQASEKQRILEINQKAAQFYRNVLLSSQGKLAARFLEQRGIDTTTAERFMLGYAPDAWDALARWLGQQRVSLADAEKAGLVIARPNPRGVGSGGDGWYDRFRNRLIFPIRNVQEQIVAFGGRVIGAGKEAKYINSPETAAFSKGRIFYGLESARRLSEEDEGIVVEGYMDLIALRQHGIENVVATLGTAMTIQHVQLLSRYTRNLVIAFDADSAGMSAVLRSSALFEEQECEVAVLMLPAGEDPDSFVRKQGREAFLQRAQESPSLIRYRLDRALDPLASKLKEGEWNAALIRKAVPILLDIRSQAEREEQIRRLADQWCHPSKERAFQAAQAIRLELQAAERRRFRPASANEKTGLDRAAESLGGAGETSSGWIKSQQELLAWMLHDETIAKQVRDQVRAEDFVKPAHREIAQAIYKRLSGKGTRNHGNVMGSLTSEEGKHLVSRLMTAGMRESPPPSVVPEHIQKVKDYPLWLKMKSYQQRLPALVEKGEISRTDSDFVEYQRLVQYFRGGQRE